MSGHAGHAIPAPTGRAAPTVTADASRRTWPVLLAMFLVNTFGYAAIGATLGVLLPTQVQVIAGAGAVPALALITGVSAIASLGAPPIVGLLSDRTRHRWGRRSPWILWGGVATAAALVLTGVAGSVPLLLVGWFIVQATANTGLNVILATIPERVPARRHGLASTVQGLGLPVGGIVGVQLGAALVDTPLLAYGLLAGLFAVASVVAALLIRERGGADDRAAADRPPVGRQLALMFSSLRDRDYRWVFVSRAVLYLGYNLVQSVTFFILQDYIRLPAGTTPAQGVATAMSLSLVLITVGTLVSGPLVDRFGHHRGFVLASSLLLTASLVLPFLSPSWTVFLVQAGLGGLALGFFLGVDLALATLVLPATGDAGRDLGVFHIALNAPQVVAPFIASLIVTQPAGYPTLFLVAAAVALVGSLTILRVRPQRAAQALAPSTPSPTDSRSAHP